MAPASNTLAFFSPRDSVNIRAFAHAITTQLNQHIENNATHHSDKFNNSVQSAWEEWRPPQPQNGLVLSSLPASSSKSQDIDDVPNTGVEELAVHSGNEASDDEDVTSGLKCIL